MRRSYSGILINTSKNTHEVVFSLLPDAKENSVLDIPSGAGAFIKRLQDKGYSNTIPVDIENVLQLKHDGFIQGDMAEPLPFKDHSIGTVVCIDGIEHIKRQFDFVKEVHRILQTGGSFIVSTPNISSLRSRFRWLLTGHHNKCKSPLDEKTPDPSHHIAMLSFPELRYILHTQGLRITSISTNRTKLINWLYLPLVPLSYLATSIVYAREKGSTTQREINREIRRSMFSRSILFGETMIIKAIKEN